MKEKDILKRLVKNDALFRNIHVITQNYEIIPNDKDHMGAYIGKRFKTRRLPISPAIC